MANNLFITACLISFAEAVVQYKPLQVYLLVWGVDFWNEAILLAALVIWLKSPLSDFGQMPARLA